MAATGTEKQQITRVASIDRHGERVTKVFRSEESAMVEAHFRKRRGHKYVRVEPVPVLQEIRDA